MWSNIRVIPYTIENTIHDEYGRVVERKGDVVVSHGVDQDTLRNVCLPCDPFYQFVKLHCVQVGCAYYLKE